MNNRPVFRMPCLVALMGLALLVAGFSVDPQAARRIDTGPEYNPGDKYLLARARKLSGSADKATLIYKRAGDNLWRLVRVEPGYQ